MVERVFYPDHAERYKHLSARDRYEFPDAVIVPFLGHRAIIKREKNLKDMTAEDCRGRERYYVLLAAKDIPVGYVTRRENH